MDLNQGLQSTAGRCSLILDDRMDPNQGLQVLLGGVVSFWDDQNGSQQGLQSTAGRCSLVLGRPEWIPTRACKVLLGDSLSTSRECQNFDREDVRTLTKRFSNQG